MVDDQASRCAPADPAGAPSMYSLWRRSGAHEFTPRQYGDGPLSWPYALSESLYSHRAMQTCWRASHAQCPFSAEAYMQVYGYYHFMRGDDLDWLWFHLYRCEVAAAAAAAEEAKEAEEAQEAAEAEGATTTVASSTAPDQTLVVMWNVCLEKSTEELRKLLNDMDFEPAHLEMIDQEQGTFALLYSALSRAKAAVISMDRTNNLPASALEEGTVRLARYCPKTISWIDNDDVKCDDVPAGLTSAPLAMMFPLVSHALWVRDEGA